MEKKVCTDIREKLSDYIDELLSETEMADVEMHMKKCPACRKELESINKTVQALRNLPRYTAHPNIVIRINDRIEKNKRWWERLNNKVVRRTFSGIAAVILCVLGLQMYFGTDIYSILKIKEKAAPIVTDKLSDEKVGNEIGSKKKAERRNKSVANAPEAPAAAQVEVKVVREEMAGEKKDIDVLVAKKEQVVVGGEFNISAGKTEEAKRLAPSSELRENELPVKETAAKLRKAVEDSKELKQMSLSDSDMSLAKDNSVMGLGISSTHYFDNDSYLQKSYEQKGLYCQNSKAENIVIQDEKSLEKMLAKSLTNLQKSVVDFKKEMVIVIFLGEQDANPKGIVLKGITAGKDKITVRYGLLPILNTDTSGKKLSPYLIKAIKKSALPVEFVVE